MQLKVSVIVTSKNEENNIARLLDSLIKQTYRNIEIILIDNFSTDKTVSIASIYTTKIYHCGPERSSQRNYGSRYAKGKYLLFLDADMRLPTTIIQECVTMALKTKSVGIIIPEDVKGYNYYSRVKKLEKSMYREVKFIEAARFITKKVFFQTEGYNEKLVAGEDWDLSNRISKLGTITRISTPLIHTGSSFFQELKQKAYYSKEFYKYAYFHPEEFYNQSGLARIRLIIHKRHLLFKDPAAAIGLIFLKGLEFIIYWLTKVYVKIMPVASK